jgi:hypothetical protein
MLEASHSINLAGMAISMAGMVLLVDFGHSVEGTKNFLM